VLSWLDKTMVASEIVPVSSAEEQRQCRVSKQSPSNGEERLSMRSKRVSRLVESVQEESIPFLVRKLTLFCKSGSVENVNLVLNRMIEIAGDDTQKVIDAVNTPGVNGKTALHVAAAQGDALVVQRLLSCGANPSIIDANQFNPVARAASRGHLVAVVAILDFVAEKEASQLINARDASGNTALLHAAAHGQEAVFELLYSRGGDISVRNCMNRNVLHKIVGSNSLSLLKLVRKLASDISDELAVQLITDRNQKNETAIMESAASGKQYAFEFLLSWQRELAQKLGSSLSSTELVHMLVWAASWEWNSVFDLLLAFETSDSVSVVQWRGERGESLLHKIAPLGNLNAVVRSLDLGADISVRDHENMSAYDVLFAQKDELSSVVNPIEVKQILALLSAEEHAQSAGTRFRDSALDSLPSDRPEDETVTLPTDEIFVDTEQDISNISKSSSRFSKKRSSLLRGFTNKSSSGSTKSTRSLKSVLSLMSA